MADPATPPEPTPQWHAEARSLVDEVSAELIRVPSDRIDASIQSALGRLAAFLPARRVFIMGFGKPGRLEMLYAHRAQGVPDLQAVFTRPAEGLYAWLVGELSGGNTLQLDPYTFPRGSNLDELATRYQLNAQIMVPAEVAGSIVTALGVEAVDGNSWSAWHATLVSQVGRLIGATLARATAEREARDSKELLTRFFAELPLQIAVFDTEMRFAWVNRAMADANGLGAESHVGTSLEDVDPGLARRLEPVFRQAVETGELQLRTLLKESESQPDIELRLFPLELSQGRLIGLVLNDLSRLSSAIQARQRAEREQSRLETELQQTRRLEALGRLAGGIAHDFNNLLSAILGYTEMLLENTDIEPQHRRDLAEIDQAARRAAGLTKQLLAFGRRQVLEVRRLNLNDELREFHGLLRRLILENVSIRMQPSVEPLLVEVDPNQFAQVVLNLSTNAAEAMPSGGVLTLSTRLLVVHEPPEGSELSPGRYAQLTVEDTGAGMSTEVLAKIFEPFFTTKPGHGTGLGLATTYGVVRQHRGHISVTSDVDTGTRFDVLFPLVEDEPLPSTERPEKRSSSVPARAATVLVVEDEPVVRRMAERMLTRLGYTIISARNGEEGLELGRQRLSEIDVLLTDVVMPGMSGQDLYQALSAQRPDLRVVFMSGYTHNVIAAQGVLEEGVLLLHKPFTVDQLSEKLRAALSD
ncbi:MAG: response regulator [Myxococcales bacterium]|nr:response regulator [Myxococcales bacterium]